METFEVQTDDIRSSLAEAAQKLGFPARFIDFRIESEEEFKDEKGNIKKRYKVVFFVNENKSALFDILSVDVDKSDKPLKAYIVVDTSNLPEGFDPSEDEIIEVIKKLLAMEGVVYGVKHKILPTVAKEIKKRLNPAQRPFRILIAEGKKPVRGKNSELKYYFNRYHAAGSVTEDGRIDYRKKNFLVPVKKGQILVEFFKPTRGEEGYDVFGNVIPQDVGVVIEDIDEIRFNEEAIERVEEGRIIRLISKRDGVIIYRNGIYDIDTSVSVDKVDIKTTGNLDANADVELEIGRGTADSVEDTIAAGMKVKAKKVTVNGDVGPDAVIEAEEVNIRGSVHHDARVYAKKAKIAICRGSVEADEVEIDLAEHARVTTRQKAVINKAVACKIFSPKVEIRDVMISSNVTTASDTVFVNRVEGSDNVIAIQPLNLPWIREKYKDLRMKLEYAGVILKTTKRKYDELASVLEKEKKKYDDVRRAIAELKRKSKEVPASLLMVVKKFKEYSEKLLKAENDYNNAKKEYERIEKEIKELETSYRKGHVVVKNLLNAGNIFIFDDNLKRIVEKPTNNVKIYVREIQGQETIVIEPNNE